MSEVYAVSFWQKYDEQNRKLVFEKREWMLHGGPMKHLTQKGVEVRATMGGYITTVMAAWSCVLHQFFSIRFFFIPFLPFKGHSAQSNLPLSFHLYAAWATCRHISSQLGSIIQSDRICWPSDFNSSKNLNLEHFQSEGPEGPELESY
jgi:hypothetical protein